MIDPLEKILEELDTIAIEMEDMENTELVLALEYMQQLREEIEIQIEH